MNEAQKIYNSHLLIEKTVLAIFIKEDKLIYNHVLRVKPTYFHNPKFELIYAIMVELLKNNMPVDELLLANFLQESEPSIDWKNEIKEIMVWFEPNDKLAYFIDRLEENYINRQLSISAIQLSSIDKPINDRISKGIQQLLDLKKSIQGNSETTISNLIKNFLNEDLVKLNEAKCSTGIKILDRCFNGGFQPKELVVLGGRPGMGKTAFLMGFCNHLIAKGGKKILFVSLKIKPKHFLEILLANKLNLPLSELLNGKLPKGFTAASEELIAAEISGDFKFHYQIDNDFIALMAEINNHKITHGLDVVVIDSLQLLDGTNNHFYQNRNNALGQGLRSLKQLAESLNFMLLISSDLSRSVDRRIISRPILSDLKDSGWIEELADKIMLIFRPEYYGIMEWEDGEQTTGQAEIVIAKNNLGTIENFRVAYNPLSFKFSELLINEIEFDYGLNIPETRRNEFEES